MPVILTLDWAVNDDDAYGTFAQRARNEVMPTLNDKVALVAVRDRKDDWPAVTLQAATRMDLADWLEDSGYVMENTDDVEFYVNMAVEV